MDLRFLLVLGGIMLLQSLLGRKKRPSGTGGLPEGEGLPPGAGERADRAGLDDVGGGAVDGHWSQPGARAEAGEPSLPPGAARSRSRAGVRGRDGLESLFSMRPTTRDAAGRGGDPVATGPRSRTKRPGPARAGAGAAGGRGRGLLAQLFAELEAQAKKELPFPGPSADAPSGPRGGRRPGGRETASAGEADRGLPSFGLPERVDSGRREAAGGQRGEVAGPPAHSRTSAESDPWALGAAGSAPPAGPPARPERGSSRSTEVGGDAAGSGAPPVESRPARAPAAQAGDPDPYGLRDRDSLKRAVVAREVLGPPVALRRGDEAASWQ